ncbi:uncharacterized protein LOC129566895 [Sitodiplosis mosellana]|uniref:uncharacterized protein LOC129566895 n=1 Tax=Sitodiplosis mosellana TaxID=263140 RepID=UPI0024438611|nr:uncharacterized protein LOC129566895 [Sitodiplosis mosellana]
MRDSNCRGKKQKINASQMLLSKRPTTKMMTTTVMIPYIYLVCLISSLDLIAQCQCSQSANHSQTSENPNYDVQEQSRKLSNDDVESVTTYTNLLSDTHPAAIIGDHIMKEFQYYNEPIEITTPRYDPPPSIDVPSNHQPAHQIDLHQSYFPQLETVPYIANVPSIPSIQSDAYIAPPPIAPAGQNHLVKVTREPFWAPEVYKLENQYIETFRSIKTSVMGMYYRMQNFISYIMSLFTLENSPIVEGRKKKGPGKLKIKKKFKKFIIPLLIAYKLKFFALIPILIGGLVLLVGSTGMAGFFFALFAAVISLKGGSGH